MKYIKRKCSVCSSEFSVPKFRIKHGRGQTCSKECRYELHSSRMKGNKSPVWKGGISYHNGYKMILRPNHPYAKGNGYVFEHRLVVEKAIGRYLNPKEVVHHINHNKLDNRTENLEITSPSKHTIHHMTGFKHSKKTKNKMSSIMKNVRKNKFWSSWSIHKSKLPKVH